MTFSQNSDFAQLTIRGIGSNVVFAGSDPSSAVYIDGVYMSRPVMVLADFLELERVEVLRGPQGTLYGRNAVGGAINLVTKPPTNTLEASARFVAGNLGTFRTEARLSGPIVRAGFWAAPRSCEAFATGLSATWTIRITPSAARTSPRCAASCTSSSIGAATCSSRRT